MIQTLAADPRARHSKQVLEYVAAGGVFQLALRIMSGRGLTIRAATMNSSQSKDGKGVMPGSNYMESPAGWTDGQTIWINYQKVATMSSASIAVNVDMLRGLVFHEFSHCLFTPMNLGRGFAGFCHGVASVNTRTAETDHIRKYGGTKESHQVAMFSGFVQNIMGIIEESRIERLGVMLWPRMRRSFRTLFLREMKSGNWTYVTEAIRTSVYENINAASVRSCYMTWLLTGFREYLPVGLREDVEIMLMAQVNALAEQVKGVGNRKQWLRDINRALVKADIAMQEYVDTDSDDIDLLMKAGANAVSSIAVVMDLIGLEHTASDTINGVRAQAGNEELKEQQPSPNEPMSSQDAMDAVGSMPDDEDDEEDADDDSDGSGTAADGDSDDDETDSDAGSGSDDEDDADEATEGSGGESDDADADDDAESGEEAGGGKSEGDSDDESDDTDGKGEGKGAPEEEPESHSDSDPNAGVGEGDKERDPRQAGNALQDAMKEADADSIEDVVTNGDDLDNVIDAVHEAIRKGVLVPEQETYRPTEMAAVGNGRHQIELAAQTISPLADQVEEAWDRRQRHGKIDMRAIISSRGESLEVFRKWRDAQEYDTSFEVVVGVDRSSSMGRLINDVCQDAWIIKSIADRYGAPCTVMAYNDLFTYLYRPDDKAGLNPRFIDSTENTSAADTINNAYTILTQSKSKHRIFVMMTDGVWSEGVAVADQVRSMRAQNVSCHFVYYGRDAIGLDRSRQSYKSVCASSGANHNDLWGFGDIHHAKPGAHTMVDVVRTFVHDLMKAAI